MRKILIVGAGQSGLQLALTLLEHDYDVTVMSARTPEEIRNGWVMSTQAMFHTALQHERDHGLNLWENEAVHYRGQGMSIGGEDGGRALNWIADWEAGYGQSIDQRVKMAGWLELFEQRGGNLMIHGVTTADLNSLTRLYDLTLVAAGKGELVQLFDRDPEKSLFDRPQRALSVAYAHGVESRPGRPGTADVWINVIPGVGELIMIPGYTLSGDCDILFFLGVPGGPLDCWSDRPAPRHQLRRMLDLMRQHVPWEYERCRNAELTDSRSTLVGGYTPVVRRPVGELPSGGAVLGMADVVVANDPVTGQGANLASKCAASYLDSIRWRGDRPFDREWMRSAFDGFWSAARHSTRFTNAMVQPPPPHVMDILGTAQSHPAVATRFVNGFNEPSDFENWFFDPGLAADYLGRVTATDS